MVDAELASNDNVNPARQDEPDNKSNQGKVLSEPDRSMGEKTCNNDTHVTTAVECTDVMSPMS